MQAVVQSTGEIPAVPLEVHIFPSPERCEGTLYNDDSHSFAHKAGDFLRLHYSCTQTTATLSVTIAAREGTHPPWWSQQELIIHDWTSARFTATTSPLSVSISPMIMPPSIAPGTFPMPPSTAAVNARNPAL